MMGDGVGADVHPGGDLFVVEPLGDEAGDGLLGTGEGPGGRRVPVAAADTQLAQPPPSAGLVAAGADLPVSAECFLQVVDCLVPVTLPALQDACVFRGGGPGPRVGVLPGGLDQAGRIAADQALAVCGGGGQGRESRVGTG